MDSDTLKLICHINYLLFILKLTEIDFNCNYKNILWTILSIVKYNWFENETYYGMVNYNFVLLSEHW